MALSLLPQTAFAADKTDSKPVTVVYTSLPFTDVADGSWCYEAVSYAYTNKLFQGTSNLTFSPDASMTRAMLVSVLYRLAGSPAVDGADNSIWYGLAQKWSLENGISDGSKMTSPVSRQQLAKILYQYAKLQEFGMGRSGEYSSFPDASRVSTYASEAMKWAVGNEILSGKSNGNLDPQSYATRAQVASILYRFLTGNSTKYNESAVTVISADGTAVPATVATPVNAKNAPGIVMLHGTGSSRDEAGNGYKMAAPVLAGEYGITSIRIDFRGNGDSKADYMNYTFKTAVEDAVAAAKYLGGLDSVDASHIGVMGWSQGGTDALLAAGEHSDIFKCVVTWAGAPDLSDMLSDEDYAAAKKDGYFTMKFDWRSDLKVSLQWCEDVKNTDVLKVFKDGYKGPVLAIAGKLDTTVDPEWANKIVATSSNKASATHFIDGMDHTFNVFSEADFHSLMDAVNATGTYFQANLK